MPTKLTPKERLTLIERALKGDNISYLCKSAGISRTLLYRWIKRYKEDPRKSKLLALKPRQKKASPSQAVPSERIKLIFDFVRTHPEWSIGKIVENLPKDDKGKPVVGHHGVQNVLKHFNLNTIEKRQNYQKQPQILQYPPDVYTTNTPEYSTIGYKTVKEEKLGLPHGEIRPQDRLAMIERVKLGEPVSRVCQIYGVSRTIFYRWLKRYEEAAEGKKLEALWDKKPVVAKYFNQAPEEYQEAVLSAVRQYPELSSHKLVGVLPQVGGQPILGNHGVQNVLRRYNLNTYEQRFAYAKLYYKPTFFTYFFGAFQTIFSFLGTQTKEARAFVVRSALVVALAVFIGTAFYGANGLFGFISRQPSITFSIGVLFSLFALAFGMFFFLYSLKYYFAISVVLSFSRRTVKEEKEEEKGQSLLEKLFGVSISMSEKSAVKEEDLYRGGGGLQPDLSHIRLERHPFVSIHLATYNEKKVIERLLAAATSMDYENYEVVVVDDSTDETVALLNKYKDHPRVKIIHRGSREGFKGGALQEALKIMDKRAEFIVVFDADFVPYPDTITQFLKYFQATAGTLDLKQVSANNQIGAIQGYQWHVLNKSENWITRGIRSEYAGSYVVERSAVEIYAGLKQIAGSVYMIRVDALKAVGWGTSITEDFELTLKLYEQGYKVMFTPYIQAPSECVSTIRRLIRQRMRWAEGHSHNVKKMFLRLLSSKNLSFLEKAEFVYLSPYYLQAFCFMLGTFFWFMAEVVFRVRLPFWTEVWGWSLIFTNLFALPLLNMVGLFLEESDEKDYLGLFSFIALSYIVAPFQGYAAIKGFLSKEEGPWFRTPKTGHITDIFTRGHFYRLISEIFGKAPAPAPAYALSTLNNATMKQWNNQYLSLATANNRFESFAIKRKRLPWLAKSVLVGLLIFTTTIVYFSYGVPLAMAASNTYYLHTGAPAGLPATADGNYMNEGAPSASAGVEMRAQRNNMNSGTVNYTFYSDILPSGDDDAILGTGQYRVNIIKNTGAPAKNIINFGIQLFVSNANGAAQNELMANTARINIGVNTNYTAVTFNIGNLTSNYSIPASNKQRVGFRIVWKNASADASAWTNLAVNNSSSPFVVIIPNFQIPEFPVEAIAIPIYTMIPFLPTLVKAMTKRGRRRKNLWQELAEDWQKFFKGLTGYEEGYVEERV